MPKTLSDLFQGNIPLCERSIPTGSALQRLSKRLALQEEKLSETLDEDGKAQLDQILNTQLEMDSVTAEENFILGFRLGVRLMVECLSEGGVSSNGKTTGKWRGEYPQAKRRALGRTVYRGV